MKSDRIFLTNDPNQYSEKEYNGIKLDDIVLKLASIKEAKENDSIPAEILAAIRGDEPEVATRKLKVASMPEAFKEWVIKDGKPVKNDDADDKDTDEDEDDKEDDKDEDKKEKKEVKASRTRKLHFDNPSQISAEALRIAEAAGDESLVKAIRSVREAVRKDLSEKLDDQAQVLAEKTAKLAKRNQYRLEVISNAKTAKKVVASDKKAVSDNGFKSPSEFNSAEKSAFVRKAMNAGFDLDYIEAFLGETVTAESNAVNEIKGVMASELPVNVKASALRGLIREAHLDSENITRLRHYWIDELGYGDEQWVDDLFTNKYDK